MTFILKQFKSKNQFYIYNNLTTTKGMMRFLYGGMNVP